ncbi:MAG: prepilin-type N-terminal cleavage/methylation domain-containing protein [Saccharofermentans sp.]|nr:prepilin-type N-terminal cleavage/methylation domain-containing protein [Saccharofermentans sp.]
MAARRNNNRYTIRKNSGGFTLAEMIVVLTIIAILAASGIFTSIGYINRATFNQNQSNAETIYHAVQTALQRLEKSGEMEEWVKGKKQPDSTITDNLITDGTVFAYTAVNQSSNISLESKFNTEYLEDFNTKYAEGKLKPNTSVHMRYILTYNPTHSSNKQSELLKTLIQPYFYDGTIFNGTITVEFDVEKGVDSYKTLHHSAKCLSVFVNSKAKDGWKASEKAYDGGVTVVPTRAFNFRRNTSRIGYYDGYSGTSVDNVYLPQIQEGIVVKKFTSEYITETETEGEGESAVEVEKTHTWLTWSATLDKNPLMGANKDVYYRFSLRNGDDTKHVLILNDDFMIDGQNITLKNANDFLGLKDKNEGEELNGYMVKRDEEFTMVYTDDVNSIVTKKSISFIAQVYVKILENDGYKTSNKADIEVKLIKIPMKISYVTGELDEKLQPKDGYYEYSLDLSRAVDKSDNPVDLISDVDRAILSIHPNYFSQDTDMTDVNDNEGIIALKKESSATIEQVTDPETTP